MENHKTFEDHRELIGCSVFYKAGALYFGAKVLDYANKYGNDRFLIKPFNGVGKAWVEKILLEVPEDEIKKYAHK